MATLLLYLVLLPLVISNDVTAHDTFGPIQTTLIQGNYMLKRFKSPELANGLLKLPSTRAIRYDMLEHGNTCYIRCLLLPIYRYVFL